MAAVSAAALSVTARSTKQPSAGYIGGMSSFGGLKSDNKVSLLGLPVCTARSFANVLSALRRPASKGNSSNSRGGALSSTCNAAEEIFRIAAIMNGLVLVGVAVGFVLLRVEAWVEEAE